MRKGSGMKAVISRPVAFTVDALAVISRSRDAGGSVRGPSSPATEDNCVTAMP